jgi:hypothetical protein
VKAPLRSVGKAGLAPHRCKENSAQPAVRALQ